MLVGADDSDSLLGTYVPGGHYDAVVIDQTGPVIALKIPVSFAVAVHRRPGHRPRR